MLDTLTESGAKIGIYIWCDRITIGASLNTTSRLNSFSTQNIILISGSMISSKFQEAFRDENAAKKEQVDGENDVKSGKKLQ